MKKIYLIPQTTVIRLHTERLIAESLKYQEGDITDESGVCTKDQGDWDDDLWDD